MKWRPCWQHGPRISKRLELWSDAAPSPAPRRGCIVHRDVAGKWRKRRRPRPPRSRDCVPGSPASLGRRSPLLSRSAAPPKAPRSLTDLSSVESHPFLAGTRMPRSIGSRAGGSSRPCPSSQRIPRAFPPPRDSMAGTRQQLSVFPEPTVRARQMIARAARLRSSRPRAASSAARACPRATPSASTLTGGLTSPFPRGLPGGARGRARESPGPVGRERLTAQAWLLEALRSRLR